MISDNKHMGNQILLIGNLTIDHNYSDGIKSTLPGGSVYFCSKTFENLNLTATIISPYGKDFPKNLLPKTDFVPSQSNFDRTLIFKNIYTNGFRRQEADNIRYSNIPRLNKLENDILKDKTIILFCPILDNIDPEDIVYIKKMLPESFIVLLPQGFFRKLSANKIVQTDWVNWRRIICYIDLIVVSDKDTVSSDSRAYEWSNYKPIIIVTKQDKGCSIYIKKNRTDVSAFYADKIKDATGAGDIFAALFVYYYNFRTRDIYKSALFANAGACLSLRFESDSLKYTYQDIINFIQSQKRRIDL